MDINKFFDLFEKDESLSFNYIKSELYDALVLNKQNLIIYDGDSFYNTVSVDSLIDVLYDRELLGEDHLVILRTDLLKLVAEDESLLNEITEFLMNNILDKKI